MDFKLRIAGARVHAGMNMGEAAKRLGISKNTLFLWEHDENRIPVYAVDAIANLYGVPKELLLCPQRMPKASES